MCLILFAFRAHRDYPLIIAANRDEFYNRPTAAASFWNDAPDVLAGKDLRMGGTWMGIHRSGRLAAVTNYRDPRRVKPDGPSRGTLVRSYLCGSEDPGPFLDGVARKAHAFSGFTLLAGSVESLFWYSNISGRPTAVEPGIHGLSNHLPDTPWPKVERGKKLLSDLIGKEPLPPVEAIMALLADRNYPPDHMLPDTGVGLERERLFSPLFVTSPVYGTCSSTVLMISAGGEAVFVERDTRPGPTEGKEVRFTVILEERHRESDAISY